MSRATNDQIMDKLEMTSAQKRLVPLIMQGLSNAEIADLLYLSESGVKFQVTTIYKRTGLNSRALLMAGLAKAGWKFADAVKVPVLELAAKVPTISSLSVGVSNVRFS